MAQMQLAIGLRERVIAEAQAAEERRSKRLRLASDEDMARRVSHTEELLRVVLGLELAAPLGRLALDGLLLGAEFLRVAGHSSWRLCLIEPCTTCEAEVATPFSTPAGLGDLVLARRDGVRPQHPPLAGCRKVWGQR